MEFDIEIGRLKNCFGDKSYPDERVLLLWKEVAALDANWFKRTIDKLIMYSRVAPLMPEFSTEITQERSRMTKEHWKQDQEIKQNHPGDVSEDEQKFFFETIIKRLSRQIGDQDWECFLKLLKPH